MKTGKTISDTLETVIEYSHESNSICVDDVANILGESNKDVIELCVLGKLQFVPYSDVSIESLQRYLFAQVEGSSIAPRPQDGHYE